MKEVDTRKLPRNAGIFQDKEPLSQVANGCGLGEGELCQAEGEKQPSGAAGNSEEHDPKSWAESRRQREARNENREAMGHADAHGQPTEMIFLV